MEAADIERLRSASRAAPRPLPPLDPSGSAYGQPALPSHALDALRLSLCLVRADRLGSHGAHAQQGVRRRHRPGELPTPVPGSWLCGACALEAATRLRSSAPRGLCPAAVECSARGLWLSPARRAPARRKGISKSALPYRRTPPSWLKVNPGEVTEHVCKLARKGLTPSQIGVILRDSHGIAQVAHVTGSKILRILKKNGA